MYSRNTENEILNANANGNVSAIEPVITVEVNFTRPIDPALRIFNHKPPLAQANIMCLVRILHLELERLVLLLLCLLQGHQVAVALLMTGMLGSLIILQKCTGQAENIPGFRRETILRDLALHLAQSGLAGPILRRVLIHREANIMNVTAQGIRRTGLIQESTLMMQNYHHQDIRLLH